jgi:hypothetical protein
MEYMLLNASRVPFGNPIGDDETWVWTYECGFPYRYVGGDGVDFSTLRNGNGTNVDLNNVYTSIAAWDPVISGHYSELDRGCMMFDISFITNNFYITDAFMGTYITNIDDSVGTISLGMVHYDPVDNATVSAADYQTFGNTNY